MNIHQIWFQGEENIPNHLKENVKKVKEIMPTYNHIIWDDVSIQELLKKTGHLNTYKKFKHLHQKVDFARYVILYEYGGIYLDMDVEMLKSLEPLIEEKMTDNISVIFSYINVDGLLDKTFIKYTINNGTIICRRGSLFMKELVDNIRVDSFYNMFPKIISIGFTTGPRYVTAIYNNSLNKNSVKILEPTYLEPCTFSGCNISNDTFLVHRHELTWFPKNFRQLYKDKNTILYIIIAVVLVLVLFLIYKRVKNQGIA